MPSAAGEAGSNLLASGDIVSRLARQLEPEQPLLRGSASPLWSVTRAVEADHTYLACEHGQGEEVGGGRLFRSGFHGIFLRLQRARV